MPLKFYRASSWAVRLRALFSLVLCSLLLIACGGGGGGGSSSGSSSGSSQSSGGNATASLSWVAPSEREDDTPIALSEIGGYEIAYGTQSGRYTETVAVNDPSATSRTVSGLSNGTYFFVIRVRDADGLLSRNSNEQRVQVN